MSSSCPARADALFNCLGKLDYSCSAPGQANASGDGADYVAIYANSGTLYVSDSECARLYNEFVNCGAGGEGGSAGGGDGGNSQGATGGGGAPGGSGGSGASGATGGSAGTGASGGMGGAAGVGGSGPMGGSAGAGAPDLANVTFSLSYDASPVDPNGEGGPAVPYDVRVCIDPARSDYIRVDNIGSGTAGSFRTAILWVKDYPSPGTIVDSCAAFSSTPPLASGYSVSWQNAYCCEFSDTFSTFDSNPRRIVVYADALEAVSESNESNNTATSEEIEP